MTNYKMIVKDENNEMVELEMQSENKSQLISDLRANGYKVNPIKIKKANVYDYIMNNTNCQIWDWKENN